MRSEDAASISSRQFISNMKKFVILVSLLSMFLPATYSWPYDYYAEAALEEVLSQTSPIIEQCVDEAQREYKNEISELSKTLKGLSQKVEEFSKKKIPCPQPTSCADVLKRNPSAPSGYYEIQRPDCSTVKVYCNMELNCNGTIGGWMRVSDLILSLLANLDLIYYYHRWQMWT